jgi:hypothetical protein
MNNAIFTIMKRFTTLILIAILAMACTKRKNVDLIVTNAKIYSVDSSFSVYNSMAIDKGKIIAILKNSDINQEYESKPY